MSPESQAIESKYIQDDALIHFIFYIYLHLRDFRNANSARRNTESTIDVRVGSKLH